VIILVALVKEDRRWVIILGALVKARPPVGDSRSFGGSKTAGGWEHILRWVIILGALVKARPPVGDSHRFCGSKTRGGLL
jgi:hypothetical protein